MIDKQKLFNQAVEGLATQGFSQSIDEQRDVCQYRDGEGRKCAVGWLIPDEWYHPKYESKTVSTYEVYSLVLPEGDRLIDNITFLENLQTCHDMARSSLEMRINLRKFAEDYKLSIPRILESFR